MHFLETTPSKRVLCTLLWCLTCVLSAIGNGAVATAGREGSRVERSKGLKDAEGSGCALVGGPVDVATPTDETEGLPQRLGKREEGRKSLFDFCSWIYTHTPLNQSIWQ